MRFQLLTSIDEIDIMDSFNWSVANAFRNHKKTHRRNTPGAQAAGCSTRAQHRSRDQEHS
jgi:hypothetical protein